MRENCDALIETLEAMVRPFRGLLVGLDEATLNRQPAAHKMSIAQIALHCFGHMRYFLTPPGGSPPFERAEWTCVPATYPLTLAQVNEQIELGRSAMAAVLASVDDAKLEGPWTLPGGKVVKLGYICARLLGHLLAHGAQIGYLRHMVQPAWSAGAAFGQLVTPLIELRYHTTADLSDTPTGRVAF